MGWSKREAWKCNPDSSAGAKRFELMQLLGGKCSCSHKGGCWHDGPCVVDDDRCLQIDHKNGGGSRDVKLHGGNAQMISYYSEHTVEAMDKLQILCANCNWVKRDRNKEFATR